MSFTRLKQVPTCEYFPEEAVRTNVQGAARGRDQQNEFLNACDVALISLVPGMARLGVPSRLYNILAAGKPIIAICDAHSEIAVVVREADVGWVVAPGDVAGLIQAIRAAAADTARRSDMGQRARALAESRFTLESTVAGFEAIFASFPGGKSREKTTAFACW